jgi:hypothetical protein
MLIQRFLHPGGAATRWVDLITTAVHWWRLLENVPGVAPNDKFYDTGTGSGSGANFGAAGSGITVLSTSLAGDAGDFSVDMSASDDHIVGQSVDYTTADPFSFEMIFHPTDISADTTTWWMGQGGGYFHFQVNDDGGGEAGTAASPLTYPAGTIVVDNTYHVVYTNDATAAGNSAKIYVNGTLVAQGTHAAVGAGVSVFYMNVTLGGGISTGGGRLCEVLLYHEVLSAADILARADALGLAP